MLVDPEALVVRFRPTSPESVLNSVAKEFRYSGRNLASVFADVARAGEGDAQVLQRILRSANRVGMTPERHSKFWVCAQAGELMNRGFSFVKDGYDGEPDLHYSVDFGPDVTLDDVERFLSAFDEGRRQDAYLNPD